MISFGSSKPNIIFSDTLPFNYGYFLILGYNKYSQSQFLVYPVSPKCLANISATSHKSLFNSNGFNGSQFSKKLMASSTAAFPSLVMILRFLPGYLYLSPSKFSSLFFKFSMTSFGFYLASLISFNKFYQDSS